MIRVGRPVSANRFETSLKKKTLRIEPVENQTMITSYKTSFFKKTKIKKIYI